MKRQSAYANSLSNPYSAPQVQQMSAQRMQQSAGLGHFQGRLESFSDEEEYIYKSSKVEEHLQQDRYAPNQVPSYQLNEREGAAGMRSYHRRQMLDTKQGLENQINGESRGQPHEQDMEIGYEDNPSPLAFEDLERKFLHEITKLVKEQADAEDVENARHREKMVEVNAKYQEKLSALRAQQATRREEFLRKESQARLHQYQQAGMSQYPNEGMIDDRAIGGIPDASAAESAQRAYASGQFDSYRERPQFSGGGRTQGTDTRVPYPSGRVYNNGARYY